MLPAGPRLRREQARNARLALLNAALADQVRRLEAGATAPPQPLLDALSRPQPAGTAVLVTVAGRSLAAVTGPETQSPAEVWQAIAATAAQPDCEGSSACVHTEPYPAGLHAVAGRRADGAITLRTADWLSPPSRRAAAAAAVKLARQAIPAPPGPPPPAGYQPYRARWAARTAVVTAALAAGLALPTAQAGGYHPSYTTSRSAATSRPDRANVPRLRGISRLGTQKKEPFRDIPCDPATGEQRGDG